MQRINFTESTLNTLKKTANCSFANAVYKLTMKAQQGLKCDDLYKKSVLMNDVNKILCNYKLDTCISFHPALEGGTNTWTFGLGSFTGTISYYLNIDGVNVFIGAGNSAANIVTDIINNSDGTGVTASLDGSYITITSPVGCFVEEDLTSIKTPAGTIPATTMVFLASKCAQEETCVDYTEEQLNCITPQDLQVLYEFTHKYKETLAKSTKKISNPSSNTNTSNSNDCCTWGSIGGNIGNQSDLVTYLANIEKNYISVKDEGTEITDDVKSINFTGNTTATDDGNGNVTVNVTGGGGGATNLSYTASPTNGVVNSDTGTDATIPLASGTNAGLMAPTQFTKLSNITVTQVVDLDTIESDTVTNNAKVSNATHTGDVTGATALTVDKTAITSKAAVTPDGADYILISDTSDSGNLKKSLISDLPGGVTPDLQQVTDIGYTTNNPIFSDDGAGNAAEVNNGFVRIVSGNTGVAKIDASLATVNYTARLPNKLTNPQTFAMLSDLTGLGGITKSTAAGTDTYTTTITGVTGYADGDTYLIRFPNGNTTGATLNINSLGAKSLYRNNDGIIIGGDIWAGAEMLCVFNSTLNGFQCIGTSPNSLFAYVVNADSVTINRGQPVYAFGSTGNRMSVKLANNQSDATSAQTYGLVYSTSIAANQKGIIIIQGVLDGLNLGGTWNDGDAVYLGNTAGTKTKTKPYAPEHLVYLGVVERANAGNGIMYVRVQNGYELQELHNVSAQTPNNGDILKYNSTTSLWESTTDLSIAYALILG